MKYHVNTVFQICFVSWLLTDKEIEETWNYKKEMFKTILKIELKNLKYDFQLVEKTVLPGNLQAFWILKKNKPKE